MISAATVRRLTLAVCAAGIAGMIVTSALNHNGAAITFGLVTAVAVLCSMLATAVAAGETGRPSREDRGGGGPPEVLAAMVEDRVRSLVDDGADETAVRSLVGEAVRLGRSLPT